MDDIQLSNDFNFTSKAITTEVVNEYGNSIISTNKTKKRYSGKYFLHYLKIILKNIGLTLILIAYLCAGGYIFRSLEVYNEAQDCYQRQNGYLKKLNSTTFRIIGMIKSINSGNIDNTQTLDEIILSILNEYANDLFVLDIKPSTNCTAILNTPDGSKWNLVNSIFFCITVITTIGYGHIAPVTFWGRITCIIYAIIGIPLMLIYLAIIGNLLARGFRLIFLNLVCCRCFYDIIRRKREQRRKRMRQWEESLREHEEEEARRRGLPLPPKKSNSQDDYDDDYESDDEDENAEEAKLHVPLTVSVIVLAIYTLIGSVIFPTWEDWSTANAAYFSFITISTIGFGDLVPGNGRFTEPKTATELLVGGLYLLFGLALLSMCLNLMKDEIIAKVHYICNCIGLKNKNTHNDDDDDDEEEEEEVNNINQQLVNQFTKPKESSTIITQNNGNEQLNNEQLNKETTQLMIKTKKIGQSETNQTKEYDNEAFQKDR
ncbi:twik family of potassium channels-related [Schistosoma mansoni]|uniref:twik family of potassium channels-related n=1 Tax=Schistosoma mansoni TaxID=6183 RepID=UPI00022DBF9F|nr:twik family of potassium channels-related [Schistosoma mansoni]|eukprot:XP_018651600.1 twik family of potassium channels-related [Schistosoma mansoni]